MSVGFPSAPRRRSRRSVAFAMAVACAGLLAAGACGNADGDDGAPPEEPWRIVSQPPCAGRVQDKALKGIERLGQPAPGATYRDPAFGTFITRITAASPS